MSAKGSRDYRHRAKAGVRPLKIGAVDIEDTKELLIASGDLKHPPGAYVGRDFTWAEVQAAATKLWRRLRPADIYERVNCDGRPRGDQA